MTKRERAIEAAARGLFIHEAVVRLGKEMEEAESSWDNPENRRWIMLRIESQRAAITEYERVMAEPDEGAQ